MVKFGYFLSSEEFGPTELVRQAKLADEHGFEALWISDHYHPSNDEQGNSPLVWSVIGTISQVTRLPIATAVTCPTVRIHPAIVAQAAATSAVLTEGRFVLGVGSGEALNEHILGDRWPPALAGRIGDGYCSSKPDRDLLQRFRDAGGAGKPTQAGTKACWPQTRRRGSRPRTGCGRPRGCLASCPGFCRRRSTSSRGRRW